MIDTPNAHQLLSAIADTLDDDGPLSDDGDGSRYLRRVVANLCRILAREAELGPESEAATISDLEALLGHRGSLVDLVAALDDRLCRNQGDLDPVAVHRVLSANVERRLSISRPGYFRSEASSDGES